MYIHTLHKCMGTCSSIISIEMYGYIRYNDTVVKRSGRKGGRHEVDRLATAHQRAKAGVARSDQGCIQKENG